jgi:hypothetical protein
MIDNTTAILYVCFKMDDEHKSASLSRKGQRAEEERRTTAEEIYEN